MGGRGTGIGEAAFWIAFARRDDHWCLVLVGHCFEMVITCQSIHKYERLGVRYL